MCLCSFSHRFFHVFIIRQVTGSCFSVLFRISLWAGLTLDVAFKRLFLFLPASIVSELSVGPRATPTGSGPRSSVCVARGMPLVTFTCLDSASVKWG